MTKGEIALFTLPAGLSYGVFSGDGVVPPNSVVRFEVELVLWLSISDVSKDGGIIKKVIERGDKNGAPGVQDEVLGTPKISYLILLFMCCAKFWNFQKVCFVL